MRLVQVSQFNYRNLRLSVRWLLRSRESTNYTYNLTPLNHEHLAWFISSVSGRPVTEIRGYIEEIKTDTELHEHIRRATERSARRGIADTEFRPGRRIGWYALARALRPHHVVETGTDKGLGACILAAAMLRNGVGRVTTIDVNPDSGYLVSGSYASAVDHLIGDSANLLGQVGPVGMFIHDSLHTYEHEMAEFRAVAPHLSPDGPVLSDHARWSGALSDWAQSTGRQFLFFCEEPSDIWHPGNGIGVAFPARHA
ncbi:class I SAM-dependent methyltransferase [Streptomyces himalayensis]|nr:class I SAM-dependent methyltransferase [Streptomyces himalayensis]